MSSDCMNVTDVIFTRVTLKRCFYFVLFFFPLLAHDDCELRNLAQCLKTNTPISHMG